MRRHGESKSYVFHRRVCMRLLLDDLLKPVDSFFAATEDSRMRAAFQSGLDVRIQGLVFQQNSAGNLRGDAPPSGGQNLRASGTSCPVEAELPHDRSGRRRARGNYGMAQAYGIRE